MSVKDVMTQAALAIGDYIDAALGTKANKGDVKQLEEWIRQNSQRLGELEARVSGLELKDTPAIEALWYDDFSNFTGKGYKVVRQASAAQTRIGGCDVIKFHLDNTSAHPATELRLMDDAVHGINAGDVWTYEIRYFIPNSWEFPTWEKKDNAKFNDVVFQLHTDSGIKNPPMSLSITHDGWWQISVKGDDKHLPPETNPKPKAAYRKYIRLAPSKRGGFTTIQMVVSFGKGGHLTLSIDGELIHDENHHIGYGHWPAKTKFGIYSWYKDYEGNPVTSRDLYVDYIKIT